MPTADRTGQRLTDPRAGFTLIEVLAALVVTGAVVAVVLPYAGRLATHWWIGEAGIESADAWMQATSRMGTDLAAAVPYGLGDAAEAMAFQAGPDAITFVRPALGTSVGLETVSYEVRPARAGTALVRTSRRFDPAAFGADVGGAATTLIEGPFRLRLVEVSTSGERRRDWSPSAGMPAAVELSAVASAREPRAAVPIAPILMAIASRAPAATRAGTTGVRSAAVPTASSRLP